jgi:hypothetical protein
MPGRKCRGHRRFVIQAVPSSEEHRDYNQIPRKMAGDCFISGAQMLFKLRKKKAPETPGPEQRLSRKGHADRKAPYTTH